MRWSFYSLTTFLFLSLSLSGQTSLNPWRDVPRSQLEGTARSRLAPLAHTFRSLQLDEAALHRILTTNRLSDAEAPALLDLPLPDGRMATFHLEPSPVMEEKLAARYPEFRTFKGRSLSAGTYTARIGWTPKGFHASIHTDEGTVYIDPYSNRRAAYYMSYFTRDNSPPEGWETFRCETDHTPETSPPLHRETASPPVQRRNKQETLPLLTYRLAMACTGEFTKFHGGTVEDALAAVVLQVNRLNHVLERDLAIRLMLVNKNDALIFTDPGMDPYTDGDQEAMLEENPVALNQLIGFGDYDIGHVVGTHSTFGGVATLGNVCSNVKGQGASAMREPVGDAFVIDILAHEIGHQLDARHSFSNCHNISPGTAYEPGGGTTIMSYSGICADPANNLQFLSDDYYHVVSLEEIFNHTRQGGGRTCGQKTPTSNVAPEVHIPQEDGFYIPVSTPFELTARAYDANGDSLTYCWEQYDLGSEPARPGEPTGNTPLFRSLPPSPSPTRTFPNPGQLLSGTTDRSEVLPAYGRTLTFRCTVRDNHPEAGAAGWDQVDFQTDSTAGPFRITMPNQAGTRWNAGRYTAVRWNVANTDNARVNCQYVNIRLSLDGGRSFPITLLNDAPNTGEAFVTVPDTVSNRARLRIEAADNIFFDISDQNFEIWPPSVPNYTLQVRNPVIRQHCLPEPVVFDIRTGAVLGYNDPVELRLLGNLPPSAVYSFSKNPIQPLEDKNIQLELDLGAFVEDTFDLRLQILAPGRDTAYRNLRFATVSNDYNSFLPLAPADGQRGIQLSTTFQWQGARDADAYEFELATSPAFGETTIERAGPMADTSYLPATLLEDNGLYFWRARPLNECGPGPYLPPQTLQTVNNICNRYESENVPVNISGTGLPTVESTIFISQEGTIKDINVPMIRANYQPVKSLRMTLISPSGKEVVLYNRDCGNTVLFRAGFDDEAPQQLLCPPDDQIVFRPVDSLAAFIGEPSFGTWTLRVKVVASGFGASGALDAWSLEFCTDAPAEDPYLVRNDTLRVPPLAANPITRQLLEARDPDNAADELEFMILTTPQFGVLFLNGDSLLAGHTFTQTDIDRGRLQYAHREEAGPKDDFRFLVQDGSGGLLASEDFQISIEEGALTSVEPVPEALRWQLFPNPVRAAMQLRFDRPLSAPALLRLYDLQGRELLRRSIGATTRHLSVDMPPLPGGIYLVSLQSKRTVQTKKIVVQR